MVLLNVIPEFSTMCMNALDAFDSINTCKGAVFDSLNCNESVWASNDTRDEGVEVEAEFESECRACEKAEEGEEEEQTTSRQVGGDRPVMIATLGEPQDTASVSSSVNPAVFRPSDRKQRRHVYTDSSTSFVPHDEDEIFRSRHPSQGSDSQCFRLCRLHRCTAFSQDSVGDAPSPSTIHPLKRDMPTPTVNHEVRMVHWDDLVHESVVDTRILA